MARAAAKSRTSLLAQGGGLDLEDEHDGREPGEDDEPSLCGVSVESGDGRDIEGEDSDREPSLGWPERVTQTPQPGGSDDRELSAEAGARVVRAARKRPRSHARTDHSGRHVDVDDNRAQRQVSVPRLASIDETPKGKTCDAIMGIIEGGKEIMDEYKGTPAP